MSKETEAKTKEKKKVTLTFTGWQLLGYSGLLLGLMVWLFVLGVLVGRGDINFWLQKWGLSIPDLARGLKLVAEPPAAPPLVPSEPAKPENSPPPGPLAAKSETVMPAAPVAPAVPEPKAPPTKEAAKAGDKSGGKKAASGGSVATDLPFQNRQDHTPGKPQKSGSKPTEPKLAKIAPGDAGAGVKKPPAAPPKPCYQIRVGETYRDPQQAQKVVAELKKKGLNVSLQQKKGAEGTVYVIKTNRLASKQEADKVAQKLKDNKYQGYLEVVRSQP